VPREARGGIWDHYSFLQGMLFHPAGRRGENSVREGRGGTGHKTRAQRNEGGPSNTLSSVVVAHLGDDGGGTLGEETGAYGQPFYFEETAHQIRLGLGTLCSLCLVFALQPGCSREPRVGNPA